MKELTIKEWAERVRGDEYALINVTTFNSERTLSRLPEPVEFLRWYTIAKIDAFSKKRIIRINEKT